MSLKMLEYYYFKLLLIALFAILILEVLNYIYKTL